VWLSSYLFLTLPKSNNLPIFDNHNRPINYLRLAVTDRCNLRCSYCMPEHGIQFLQKSALLTYEEMLRIVRVLATEGLNKVRITGGEPFVRQGLMGFLEKLVVVPGLQQVAITTNGVLTGAYLKQLTQLGIKNINLSLDSLDPRRFAAITRRNEFDAVKKCLDDMLALDFDVKLNCVAMQGQNDGDIAALAAYTKNHKLAVRFIEEMPFNGAGQGQTELYWSAKKILSHLQEQFAGIYKIEDGPNSTSYNYQIPNYQGTVGIIAAYTRSFCGSCNRIRLTPQGELKTCLYQQKGYQIRELLRTEPNDQVLKPLLLQAIHTRYKDGHQAEKAGNSFTESMTSIGG
jgi:molybdenum cofactor biosynthesis protein A